MTLKTLFTGWHFTRWLRLGLGVLIIIQAIHAMDAVLGIIAAVFLFQAVTNSGCCSDAACEVTQKSKEEG